jgi:hypothetical protein
LVFNSETDSEDWKCIFVVFAHATSHILSILTTGSPPSSGPDGSIWTTPERMSFVCRNADLAALYHSSKKIGLFLLLGKMAEEDDLQKAFYWYEQAKKNGKLTNNEFIAAHAIWKLTLKQIYSGSWQDLLNEIQWAYDVIINQQNNVVSDNEDQRRDSTSIKQLISIEITEEVEKSVNDWVCYLIVVVILRLCSYRQEEDIYQEGCQLVAFCRSMPTRESTSSFWFDISNAVESSIVKKENYTSVWEIVKNFEKPINAWSLGGLCAGHVGTPVASYLHHVNLAYYLTQKFQVTPEFHDLLLSYFETFWKNRIDNQSFLFSSPKQVRNEFVVACSEPKEKRIKSILKAISFGIPTQKLSPEISKWLWK